MDRLRIQIIREGSLVIIKLGHVHHILRLLPEISGSGPARTGQGQLAIEDIPQLGRTNPPTSTDLDTGDVIHAK